MIEPLEAAFAARSADEVQDAIYALGKSCDETEMIPEGIAEQLLLMLRRPEVQSSDLAGHILNFFEFEALALTQNSKDKCRAFLVECGGQFDDIHSAQVVGELLHGDYLKPAPLEQPRKKPRWGSEKKAKDR
jgi:hypothetical protein